ncbi:MAG: hypothetical protein R2991_07395 [Thermoanaerobaculia bacterium]
MPRPDPLLSDDSGTRAPERETRRPIGVRGRSAGLLDRWLGPGPEGRSDDVCDYERRLRGLDLLLDVQAAYTGRAAEPAPPEHLRDRSG